jgi:hypothetical protein
LFSSGGNINILQTCKIQGKERSTVSVLTKPLMLEARGSSMWFSSKIGVNFEKEYCLSLRLLKSEEQYLWAK